MALFSDREFGKAPAVKEEISIDVWNGIVSIYESLVGNHSLDSDFPEMCEDGNLISGFDRYKFDHLLKATIPNIDTPIRIKHIEVKASQAGWGFDEPEVKPVEPIDSSLKETVAILDFIEFCYQHIYDAKSVGAYHEFFKHFHYSFPTRHEAKAKFISDINYLFQRNGIAYEMSGSGEIRRLLPAEMQSVIKKTYQTKDEILNKLLNEAAENIHVPAITARKHGLERLWDAFERAKTYYPAKKNISAQQLLAEMSAGSIPIEEMLTTEARQLTEIGNKFQIRHFERDKEPVIHPEHIDYLFFRAYALINLMMKTLEN